MFMIYNCFNASTQKSTPDLMLVLLFWWCWVRTPGDLGRKIGSVRK